MYNYSVYALWLSIPPGVAWVILYVFIVALRCCLGDLPYLGMMNFLLGNVIDEAREENGETKYFIRGKQLKGRFRKLSCFVQRLPTRDMCSDDILVCILCGRDLQL